MLRMIVVACVLGISGAAIAESYPDAYRTAFVDSCIKTSKGNSTACQCMMAKIEATIPYEKMKEFHIAKKLGVQPDQDTSHKFVAAIASCSD